jgi:hypothetical protein
MCPGEAEKGLIMNQKTLMWLVGLLLTILTLMTAWHQSTFANLHKEYVSLESYRCDQLRIEKKLDDILKYLINKSGKDAGP